MTARITTIIPTHRRPALLQRAIASALRQTHRDVLVCVYDNASGDETEATVASLAGADARIRYYRHPHPVSAVENFLFGMERVDSDYFSFLSDDDVLFPNFYASALVQLRAHPEALFSAGSTIEYDEDGRVRFAPLAYWPRQGLYRPPSGFLAMLGNRHPTWTSILFRREVLDTVGKLDTGIGGPFDLDYELRVASRCAYAVFFEPSAAYVHHASRLSSAEDLKIIDGFECIRAKLTQDVRIDPRLRERIGALLDRQMRHKLYEIAGKSLAAGRLGQAADAAAMLKARFSTRLGAALIACVELSRRLQGVQAAFAGLEEARQKLRAASTRKHLRRTIGQDGSAYSSLISTASG